MIIERFRLQSRTVKATLTVFAILLYALAYEPLYNRFGAGASALFAIPVMLAGWSFGLWGGIIAGLLSFPLSTLFLNATAQSGWDVILREWIPLTVVTVLGGVIGWLSDLNRQLKRELAERKHVDRNLQDSEVRFRRLFETARDGILLLDAGTGQITEVNPFLIEMLGYSREEFLGKKLWEIGPIKDVISSQTAFQELQSAEYIRYENLPLETKQGEQINVEFVSNVYRVDGAEVIQCNIRDITRRKQAEKSLEEAHTSLGSRLVDLQQRNLEINLLGETSNLLQSCVTATEACTVIGQFAPQLFPGESGSVGLLDTAHNVIRTGIRWGEKHTTHDEQMFEPDACWALRRGRLHHVQNTEAGLVCAHLSVPLPAAYLCIPLSAQNETFGLLHLSAPPGTSARLTEEKQQLAVTLAEHISLALANLKLRETLHSQSVRDPLTGLFNRRYMEESLEREIHRAKRKEHPLGIIMLDLDNFKRFNDTFGHEAGDLLLHEVGNFLQRHIRRQDIGCRYGGEEFTLILPEASLEATHQRAEHLRERINQLQVDYRSQVLESLTVSMGIAAMPDHGSTSVALLRAADLALYQAKAGGRNLVSIADTPQ